MIGTANAAVFDIAIVQRRAMMGTIEPEQTDAAPVIAKQHQLFAERSDRLGERRAVRGSRRRPANGGETTRQRACRG